MYQIGIFFATCDTKCCTVSKLLWYKIFRENYMQKGNDKKQLRKPQHQARPGIQKKLSPQPVFDHPGKQGSNKLLGKKLLITGADSGIGKAVAVLFAEEQGNLFIQMVERSLMYRLVWKSEVGCRKSDVGSRMSDVGSRKSDVGCR